MTNKLCQSFYYATNHSILRQEQARSHEKVAESKDSPFSVCKKWLHICLPKTNTVCMSTEFIFNSFSPLFAAQLKTRDFCLRLKFSLGYYLKLGQHSVGSLSKIVGLSNPNNTWTSHPSGYTNRIAVLRYLDFTRDVDRKIKSASSRASIQIGKNSVCPCLLLKKRR